MSRRLVFIVVVAAFLRASFVWAQGPPIPLPPGGGNIQAPPRDNQAPKVGTARIRGHVVAADSGQPLRKAQVRAFSTELRENRATSTDAEGRFELKDLPAGRYNITASKGSFVSLQFGQLRPFTAGKPLEIRDGQTIEKIDFSLPRGGIITGRIVDEYGEPVADVSVAPMRYQYAQGRRRLTPSGRQSTTNDIGEFRIFGLPPGQFYLMATLRSGMVMMGETDERSGYAPTYYPGTPNVAEAQRITVGMGQMLTDLNMTLMPTRTARISGVAFDSSGKPLSGGMVMVTQTSGGLFMSSTGGQIRADGTFTVSSVAPGEYTIRAQSMGGFGDVPEVATARITVAGDDINGLQLAVGKAATISGRVLVPPGTQSFQPSTVRVVTAPADPDQMMMPPGGGGKINDDLTFELKVPPGRALIRLLARTAGEWVTKAQRLDGVDIMDRGIEVKPGEDIAGLEIELTNQQSQVSGLVSNSRGELVKDYTVVVFSHDRERWTYPQTRYVKAGQPDQDGRFKVTGLPAGDYYAVAVNYLEPGESNDPELLDRIRDRGVRFSLADGETKTLDLKISSST